MHPFPHTYTTSADCVAKGFVTITSNGLPSLNTAPPAEFDGPGDQWSPETLLLASVADCFCLTFRAIAAASHLEWNTLHCQVNGVLDRVEGKTRFTDIDIQAALSVPASTRTEVAQRLLEKSEQNCLISNSLNARIALKADVITQE